MFPLVRVRFNVQMASLFVTGVDARVDDSRLAAGMKMTFADCIVTLRIVGTPAWPATLTWQISVGQSHDCCAPSSRAHCSTAPAHAKRCQIRGRLDDIHFKYVVDLR